MENKYSNMKDRWTYSQYDEAKYLNKELDKLKETWNVNSKIISGIISDWNSIDKNLVKNEGINPEILKFFEDKYSDKLLLKIDKIWIQSMTSNALKTEWINCINDLLSISYKKMNRFKQIWPKGIKELSSKLRELWFIYIDQLLWWNLYIGWVLYSND